MSNPTRRIHALINQIAPSIAPANASFPGCASVIDVQPCASHAANPADSHAPLPASLQLPGIRLADRIALITGAGSGIGRASALLFALQGASLWLADLSEEGLAETKRLILAAVPAASSRLEVQTVDVAADGANEAMVAACIARYGTLHILFANAGVLGTLGFHNTSASDFARTLNINVIAVHLAFRAAAAHMLSKGPSHGGVLLATSSVAGLRAGAGPVDYSASKAAVVNLVQSTAMELTGTGIRVNAINPGLIETGMTEIIFHAARVRNNTGKIGQLNPLRRAGSPHEIASVALFLASAESSYVNGQAIVVDGGLSCAHPFMPSAIRSTKSGAGTKPVK